MKINDLLVQLQNAAISDYEAETVEILACRAGFWKKCQKCLYVNQPEDKTCYNCKSDMGE